jgi:hypothetical protein
MEPLDLLGKFIYLNLKDGKQLLFKVTACGPEWLEGHDSERMNLTIQLSDIAFVLGGRP